MATTGGTRQMDITTCRRGVAYWSMASHGRKSPYHVTLHSETCFIRMGMTYRRKMLEKLRKSSTISRFLPGLTE